MSFFGSRDKKKKEQEKAEMDALAVQQNAPVLDPRADCLTATRLKLNKLKLLCSFFKNDLLEQIYDQSEFVYSIFDKNKDLNYRKLDQYSYYYTDNLIVLLDKLKKGREENIIILLEKLDRHNAKLIKYKPIQVDNKRLENEKKKWNSYIGLELARTYRQLSGFESSEIKVRPTKADLSFCVKMPECNYYNIPKDKFDPLTDYKLEEYYIGALYHVHRKLMGKLNKALFAVTFDKAFTCGDDMFFYSFTIKDVSDIFIFIPHKMSFKLVSGPDIIPLENENTSYWGKINNEIQTATELIEKDKLKLDDQKKIVEQEIISVLETYLKKINEAELLNSLEEIDIDRRTLEEVLKLQRFEI